MSSHNSIIAIVFGIIAIWAVLLDAFETVVLPRRVLRNFKLTAYFYRRTWLPWAISRAASRRFAAAEFSGIFRATVTDTAPRFLGGGADFRICADSVRNWRTRTTQPGAAHVRQDSVSQRRDFFTLGYGDIVPTSGAARALSVFEAGMGFAFLGVVIGYIPVVYSSFSRREIQISMLDARAGSPPSAVELLVRLAGRSNDLGMDQRVLDDVLRDWERWAGGIAGEPDFVSGAQLLSFAAQQPVMAGSADDDARCEFIGADGD